MNEAYILAAIFVPIVLAYIAGFVHGHVDRRVNNWFMRRDRSEQ